MSLRKCKVLVVLLAFLAGGFAVPASAAAKCRQRKVMGNVRVCVEECRGGNLRAEFTGGSPNAVIPITLNCLQMELPTDGYGRAYLSLDNLVGKKLKLKVVDLSGPLPREHSAKIKCKGQ